MKTQTSKSQKRSISKIAANCRAGNTGLPGNFLVKEKDIANIANISKISDSDTESVDLKKPKFENRVARNWTFTWNNYPADWRDFFEDRKDLIEKIWAEEEIGEKGTPHIQGWLKLVQKNNAKTFLGLSKVIHWEVMRETERKNTKYCSKDKTPNLHWGVKIPYNVKIQNWDPWMIELKEVLSLPLGTPYAMRKIHWIWEPEGNVAKTEFLKWLYLNVPGTIPISGRATDIKHVIAKYVQKEGETPKAIIVNIPRSSLQFISYTALEEVKDMFFMSGKYDGDIICGERPHIIILANDRPETFKMSEDRWMIGRIVDKKIEWENGAPPLEGLRALGPLAGAEEENCSQDLLDSREE